MFKAFGLFVEVSPVVPDSGIIKLAEGTEDNRSVFKVLSVGNKVEGIEVGNNVYAMRSAKFVDKGTGVEIRLCHVNEIMAVDPDGGEIKAAPVIDIVTPIGDPGLN